MDKPHPFAHFRSRLIRGLLVVTPLLVTLWLLRILFDLVDGNVTPIVVAVLKAIGAEGVEHWQVMPGFPLVGLVVTVVLVYLLGVFTGNLAGRRVLLWFESFILRIPLVKGIYGSARQLLDAFGMTSKSAFSKVVLVEYPRRGLWTVGFVTSESAHRLPGGMDGVSGPWVPVFLPTTPNPTSGWLLLVPRDELLVLDVSIEAGVKLIVSGGIVSPGDLGAHVRTWSEPEPEPAPSREAAEAS